MHHDDFLSLESKTLDKVRLTSAPMKRDLLPWLCGATQLFSQKVSAAPSGTFIKFDVRRGSKPCNANYNQHKNRNLKTTVLVSLIFLLTNCYGQTPNESGNKLYSDTVDLPLPKPTREDIAMPKDYDHCIDLTGDDYIIVISRQKYVKLNIPELSSFVKANQSRIIKQKISVISDSATNYEKIINTIDLLTEAKINNYKLVSVNGKLPRTSPIVVQSGKPFTKDIDLSDSTVLIISIGSGLFGTSLLNNIQVQTALDLDKFVANNKENINPNKIVIAASANLPFIALEPVLFVLNKHKYHHYQIVTKD
jgi:biopolymer transport protein ExbD